MTKKQSNISINIELDTNNIPEKIQWQASDGQQELTDYKSSIFILLGFKI